MAPQLELIFYSKYIVVMLYVYNTLTIDVNKQTYCLRLMKVNIS